MEKKMNDICEMKNRLITLTQTAMEDPKIDVHTMGEMVDMVKDCYEMEKDCWKACYYKSIVEAMKEEKEHPESARYGYDHYRYASTGQFAPKGHGTYHAGYPMNDHMMPEWDMSNGPYGYRSSASMRSSGGMGTGRSSNRYGYPMDERGMTPYDMFQESRKHYHESKTPEARKEMEHHAKEHVEEAMDSFRDIWDESSPELRKEMKKHLTNLVNSMTV